MRLNKFIAKLLRTTITTSLCVLLFTEPMLRAQDRTHSGSSRSTERRNSGSRGRNLPNELDRKLSPDLKAKLNDSTVDRVKIVLQFNAVPSAQTIEILGRAGVLINPKDKFEKLESRTVELPKSLVVELAAQSEMNFASSNREVRSLGHLSSTTGADLARGLIGTSISSNLDGSGIGIAFIDSGIDREHKSFLDRNGKRRFVYGIDFTDVELEAPEEDKYGHGTHVASVAVGNGRVASNAYLGIAPNANMINLRVLDDTGKGTVTNVLRALE